MDWNAIKTEYITTDTSYRKLAKKHGISLGKLQRRATDEGWPEAKSQFESKTVSDAVNAVTKNFVSRTKRLQDVTDKLLDKIELTIENIDGVKSSRAVKDVSDALKNVKDIMMVKADIDIREQEARIAKLQKETEKGNDFDPDQFGVVYLPVVAPMPEPPEDDADG